MHNPHMSEMKRLMALMESADAPSSEPHDELFAQYKELFKAIPVYHGEAYEYTGYWSGIVSKAEAEKFFSHYEVRDLEDAADLWNEEFSDRYASYNALNASLGDVDMNMASEYAVEGQWPADEKPAPSFVKDVHEMCESIPTDGDMVEVLVRTDYDAASRNDITSAMVEMGLTPTTNRYVKSERAYRAQCTYRGARADVKMDDLKHYIDRMEDKDEASRRSSVAFYWIQQ